LIAILSPPAAIYLQKHPHISNLPNILNNPIEYLTGISAQRGDLLRKELNIYTFKDMLEHYPLRHIDKTNVDKIGSIHQTDEYAYVAGTLQDMNLVGEGRSKRLVAHLKDGTGIIELVWFQGINWVQKMLLPGHNYLAFGRLGFFMGKPQIAHPDIEPYTPQKAGGKEHLEPIYPSTEKLKARGLNGAAFSKFTQDLFQRINSKDLPENLPADITKRYKLLPRFDAFKQIHFPSSEKHYQQALRRLKFEELFYAQLRINLIKLQRHRFSKGWAFEKVGDLFNNFYSHYLPFSLTNAQKNVLKEIRKDFGTGKQMNRLLQGDVGSGKTIVALLCMLLAADNGFQSVLMAPTEILAQQHFSSLTELLKGIPVEIRLLTGSTSAKIRKEILAGCA
ncbi:MAG: DEAD/DEAH box helicase, partial [Chitinophagaceae bacterium]